MAFNKKIQPPVVVLYPKDIALIINRSHRTAKLLYQKMRKRLEKERHQYITIVDFCNYTSIQEHLVRQILEG